MPKFRTAVLIDDDPIFRELTCMHLLKHHCARVIQAADGISARRQLEASHRDIDLILSDINMPDFDGVEFLGELNARNIRCPLIMISGAPEAVAKATTSLATAYGLNLRGFLPKPIRHQALDALLNSVEPAYAA